MYSLGFLAAPLDEQVCGLSSLMATTMMSATMMWGHRQTPTTIGHRMPMAMVPLLDMVVPIISWIGRPNPVPIDNSTGLRNLNPVRCGRQYHGIYSLDRHNYWPAVRINCYRAAGQNHSRKNYQKNRFEAFHAPLSFPFIFISKLPYFTPKIAFCQSL